MFAGMLRRGTAWIVRGAVLGVIACLPSNAASAATPAEAVERIEAISGKIERDAQGRVIAVDLAAGRNAVDDSAVTLLAAFPHLRMVKAAGAGVTNRAIASLANLRTLEDLTLAGSGIDENGIRLLTRLPKLKALDLRATPLVNA